MMPFASPSEISPCTMNGTLPNADGWQTVKFDKPVQGRYICLEALSEQGGSTTMTSAAELIATDSIPMGDEIKNYPVTVLSVGELIGDAILRIHNDESVNSLFEV